MRNEQFSRNALYRFAAVCFTSLDDYDDCWLLNDRKRDAIVRNNYRIIKMKGIVSAAMYEGKV